MKTMKWLIRREFWEHKGAFFWAPLVLSAIMSIFIVIILALGVSADGIRVSYSANGVQGSLNTLAGHLSDEQKGQLVSVMSNGYMFVSAPIFMTLSFVVFFYCLTGLYEERKDRSILFWKSLPITDGMTVLSKLAMAAVVAPLITIAIATVTSLLVLIMYCIVLASNGMNVFGMLLTSSAFYLTPFQFVGLIPVYLLWALPTIGWLMMVSAWARSKLFLWAVGVPGLTVALLFWADSMFHFDWNISWFMKNIVARILLGVIPGVWIPFAGIEIEQLFTQVHEGIKMSAIFTQSWATLRNPGLWVGVAAGVIMIYVAKSIRRWREES